VPHELNSLPPAAPLVPPAAPTTTPGAPVPPATPGAPAAGSAPRRPSRLRALLVSLAVLAVGAALGAGGFAFEQSHVSWRPQVSRTGDGWKISTSHGLKLGSAALMPSHIVWNAGPFTVLTDLHDGTSKLLGARAFAGELTAPSASERYVVWMDIHLQGANVVWVYDTRNRRRTQLAGTGGITRSPALAGSVAVWAESLGETRGFEVRGVDLSTGRRSVIAETALAQDLVGGGDLTAWVSRPAAAEPPVITVADVRSGVRRQVAPYAQPGGRLIGFAVAGRTLVWARDSGVTAGEQILSFDVDTGATRVLASVRGVACVAASGDLVVWAESPSGTEATIMGLRQSDGSSSAIAVLPGGPPSDVYASGETVAWRVSPAFLFDSYLQTAAAPSGLTATAAGTGGWAAAGLGPRADGRRTAAAAGSGASRRAGRPAATRAGR